MFVNQIIGDESENLGSTADKFFFPNKLNDQRVDEGPNDEKKQQREALKKKKKKALAFIRLNIQPGLLMDALKPTQPRNFSLVALLLVLLLLLG